jgi:hypothetical protein
MAFRSALAAYLLGSGDDRLIEAALRLRPKGGLRSRTYATLIALLSATGLRISEALKLTIADVTHDGLLIRETKFRKTRLVPLHDTAVAGLKRYLARRRPRSEADPVFVDARGLPLRYIGGQRDLRQDPLSGTLKLTLLGIGTREQRLRRSVQSWCATGILPLRGAGITRTALDISSSERALRLAGLRALRIFARRNRELPNFQNLIAQRLQVLVLFAALPLLDFVHRLPAGDDHTLGSIARKAGDFVGPNDEATTVGFDGRQHLGHIFVRVLFLVEQCLFRDDEHRWTRGVGCCRCLCLELCDASREHCTDRHTCQKR